MALKDSLPARFTIERISEPSSPRRFLSITDDGTKGWADGLSAVVLFASEGAAKAFRRFRMGQHATDARVVRYTVH